MALSAKASQIIIISIITLISLPFVFYIAFIVLYRISATPQDSKYLTLEPKIYNLEGLNTPYDDFNAAGLDELNMPALGIDALIVFASNAESEGERFTIDQGRLQITQQPYWGHHDKKPPPPVIKTERFGKFSGIPETDFNQMGPTPLATSAIIPRPYLEPAEYNTNDERYFLIDEDLFIDRETMPWSAEGKLMDGGVWMFDSDWEGRRNLYFVDSEEQVIPFFGNSPLADDAYITYDFKRHVLYFSSNRSGRYQLYRYNNYTQNTNFAEWLGDISLASELEPADIFNGEGNSIAPYVEDNLFFFASDRPGGHGGYDLYLSEYDDAAWNTPVNAQELMPPKVFLNTKANEFRPFLITVNITLDEESDFYDPYESFYVLLFSSDRSGGKGGYDLYITALPWMVFEY
jgi:hypothetical protein